MKKNQKNYKCDTCIQELLCKTLGAELSKHAGYENGKSMDRFSLRNKVSKDYTCDKYKYKYIEYPLEVDNIRVEFIPPELLNSNKKLVAVKPASSDKTYFGYYLGDLSSGVFSSYNAGLKELSIKSMNNPAIFVPELSRIVFGYESFWREIESIDELREITDDEIENTWYVKILKEMEGGINEQDM